MDHDKHLIEATGEGRIEAVEWGDVQPYVMFMTGRCGSTWLGKLLANTGVAGDPQEWLNSEVVPFAGVAADTLPGYFANVVERHSVGGRFGIQVDPERLDDTLHLVDWSATFPPSTPTFFLYRRHLLAQAWSWVRAEKSGYWHTPDPDDPADQERPALLPEHVPTVRELADKVVDLRRQEERLFAFWAERGYQPHFVEYESLAADPAGTVSAILRHLGVSAGVTVAEAKMRPLTYDDSKTEALARFAGFNWPALSALERDRFGVGADWLADHLVGVEPIAAHLVGADSLAEF